MKLWFRWLWRVKIGHHLYPLTNYQVGQRYIPWKDYSGLTKKGFLL